jgi:hypothetical protein
MTHFDKPLDFHGHALVAAHRVPRAAAIKTAFLLALLIAYGLGFAVLYPLVRTSAAKGADDGNDPMFFVGS